MKPFQPSLKTLLRDERGAILIITTVYLPVLVGFFSLAVDMANVLRTRNMLQVAAESAALAATSQLPDPSQSVSLAKTYAAANMPTATYGAVLATADVVLGKWPATCATYTNCFSKLPSGSDCTTFQCNSVQVTTRMTTANGNALQLAFAPMIGIKTFDVTATAIAVYGGAGAQAWNVVNRARHFTIIHRPKLMSKLPYQCEGCGYGIAELCQSERWLGFEIRCEPADGHLHRGSRPDRCDHDRR